LDLLINDSVTELLILASVQHQYFVMTIIPELV